MAAPRLCFSRASFGDSQSLERFASCHGITAQRSWIVVSGGLGLDEYPLVQTGSSTQQLPSVELQRSKGGFLFASLLGQNLPLCAVEHVVKKLGDVFVTAVYLRRCARSQNSRCVELGGVIDSSTQQ